MTKAIVTLTLNPAIDKSAAVDQVVAERKLRCSRPRYEPGGGGINVSRAIRRLGGKSIAIYPCGGATGDTLQELINREGLDHRSIPARKPTRENLVITERSTGRQYRFGMPGPGISKEEWEQCLSVLYSMKPYYVVASGSLPPSAPDDLYAQIAHIVTDIGSKVIVDTSGQALRSAIETGVYLIKPNMREFGELLSKDITDEAEVKKAAMQLVEKGRSRVIVISLGAGGALLVSEEGCEHVRAPTVPIVSKIGAGDSMVAGIVLSLARGNSLQDAVRFGVAAGAAAVMTAGTELCGREDTERLYRQMTTRT
jgi:6-phosphofructokinase 2